MPSSRESVVNLALSGDELKDIIRADIDRLLAADGMLSSNAAFGKVGYTLALKLYTDNPFFAPQVTTVVSQPASIQQLEDNPKLASVERPPLPASEKMTFGESVLHREIDSPNRERVRLGIPVPVQVQQQDGGRTIERVQYPKQDTQDDDQYVGLVDEAEARRRGWNIIEPDK